MLFYSWEEARGFSGFSDDQEYSCNELLLDTNYNDEALKKLCYDQGIFNEDKYNNLFTPSGKRKTYMPSRIYLRMVHSHLSGRPLYFNNAKNLMVLGSRGWGKSYMSAAIVMHEFLFDGMTNYAQYKSQLAGLSTGNLEGLPSTEIIVGAADAKYSTDTLTKAKLYLENLPGKFVVGKKTYPSPLFKKYAGSWSSGSNIVARYSKKLGSNWIITGTGTTIKHRTYKDNEFAAQGSRASVSLYEEIGMFNNLIKTFNANVDTQQDGSYKYGSSLLVGTGGDFDGGGTLDAYEIFYNPEKYDMVVFEDNWENRGSIGLFVGAYLADDTFRNELGQTDVQRSLDLLEATRLKLRQQKGSISRLNNYIQYRPIKPSEMFLARSGNTFPIDELKNRQARLEQIEDISYLEKKVTLYFDSKSPYGVNYNLDINNELVSINNYP